jgi:hypothetical protein
VPGASRSGIVGVLGDRLKVRVAAPAEAGKANRAVVELLKGGLGASDVEIVSGSSSPEKQVRIETADPAALLRRLSNYERPESARRKP